MRNVLKLIALLTMVIDHVGAVLYPNIIVLRMIGRISFPIFAYLLALGYKSTHNIKKYLKRLLLFGLLSEIPYILAFNSDNLNIFFTLVLGLMAIMLYEKKEYLYIIIVFCFAVFAHVDYGIYGVFVIFFMYVYVYYSKMIGTILFILATFVYSYFNVLQIFAILSIPLIGLLENIPKDIDIKKYKYVFYAFYPLHLVLLYLIRLM